MRNRRARELGLASRNRSLESVSNVSKSADLSTALFMVTMTSRLIMSCLLARVVFLLGLISVSQVDGFVATQTCASKTTHDAPAASLYAHECSDVNRRFFAASVATTTLATLISPLPVRAKGGDSASMKVPGVGSYIDYLIKKNDEQQGTDPSVMLYKGADLETQLRRLSDAANRLTEIKDLAEDKKWSQVQGVITGPLGTLLQTMNTVTTASGGDKKVKDAATKVKGDVIAIGQAATKKSVEGCIEGADLAMKDLEAFVKVAFE